MPEDDVWRLLLQLGCPAVIPDPQDVLAGVSALGTKEAYALILKHRIYRSALERLAAAVDAVDAGPARAASGAVQDLLGRLADLWEEESRRRLRVRPVVTQVLARADESGASVIKGLALREWYADPSLRHEGDVDLQVPTWARAHDLCGWLRRTGWEWDRDELPWLKFTDGGLLYGQLSLVLPRDGEIVTRVDLHLGPFSVGHGGLLPLLGWQPGTVLDVRGRVPDAACSIALIGVHALNDTLLSVKDVEDAAAVLRVDPDVDWASVEAVSRPAGSWEAVRQIVSWASHLHHVTSPWPGVVEGPLRPVPRGGQDRAAWFAQLAGHHEPGPAGGLQASFLTEEARRYFSADLTPRVDANGQAFDPADRRRTACWRLIPPAGWSSLADPANAADPADAPGGPGGGVVHEPLADDLVLLTRGRASAVRTLGEVFVPTVWGPVRPESLALARHVARHLTARQLAEG